MDVATQINYAVCLKKLSNKSDLKIANAPKTKKKKLFGGTVKKPVFNILLKD